MSIRCINADQNTLTIFRNGWSPENVGYVLNVIHEGPPNTPYPGGFSRVVYEMRQALPDCEMASYISLSYVKNLGSACSPRRTLPAEAFEASEVTADGRINYSRIATATKVVNLMRAELSYRRDTENLKSVWFDDFPTPFVQSELDSYVLFLGWLQVALKGEVSTRVNASNLFYGSQTEGELVALAKCCDGTCLEGLGLDEERKDVKRFNYRLQVLAAHQSAITICCPHTQSKEAYDEWCNKVVEELQPSFDTGRVFLAYPTQWSAPKWA